MDLTTPCTMQGCMNSLDRTTGWTHGFLLLTPRSIASSPVLFLDSPPERGEEKRAWYTLTAHVQDLHPLAQDPWANGCTGSALGLYVPKAKISQEL